MPFIIGIMMRTLIVGPAAGSDDAKLITIFSVAAWIGVLFLSTRFLIGRKHGRPGGMWSCPNCKDLNQSYSVICEACRQPYAARQ
jgi:hypothetical protein